MVMRSNPVRWAALAFATAGCGAPTRRLGDNQSASLWETLAAEGRFFQRFLAGEGWLTLAAIAIATMVFWLVLSLTVRVLADSGYDDQRRSGQLRILGRVMVVLIASGFVGRFAFRVAPTTSLALTVAALGFSLVLGLTRLRGAWAIISLTISGRLREGDIITLGDHNGRLQYIGLLRLVLEQPGGATLLVSSRLLTQHELIVLPAGSPPSLRFMWHTDSTEQKRAMAETKAAACPYRLLARTPQANETAEGIEIIMNVWSNDQLRDARNWLASTFEAVDQS